MMPLAQSLPQSVPLSASLPSGAYIPPQCGERGIRVVAGNGNRELAKQVARELNVELTHCVVGQRTCGEVTIDLYENVADCDVYVVQPTCGHETAELNQTVLELLFLIRQLRLKHAARITALIPFFAYARQDRKTDLRAPISAAAISRLIDMMGVDRVVTLDLHAGQIQGYFNNRAPLDNLNMAHDFAQYVRSRTWFNPDTTVIVSPDAGGVARAHHFADILNVSHIVTIMKRRAKAGVVSEMQTVGDVAGYSCIILDDMCDTGGTLVAACRLLRKMGASRVFACITHGILNDPCIDRVNGCDELEELIISDSIPQDEHMRRCTKLRVLTIAPLLAQALRAYNGERSISELFRRPATPSPRLSQPRVAVSPLVTGEGGPYLFPISPAPHVLGATPMTGGGSLVGSHSLNQTQPPHSMGSAAAAAAAAAGVASPGAGDVSFPMSKAGSGTATPSSHSTPKAGLVGRPLDT